jgi:hypothetical protein
LLEALPSLDTHSASLLVIDVSDAFHIIPVCKAEMKYLSTQIGGKFQQYFVLLFGPKAAPTIWGRAAAFINRSAQAVIGDRAGRLQMFVDDPVCIVTGTELDKRRTVLRLLLWWQILGVPLAWSKARYGQRLDWIGATIEVTRTSVSVHSSARYAQTKVGAINWSSKFHGRVGADIVSVSGSPLGCSVF